MASNRSIESRKKIGVLVPIGTSISEFVALYVETLEEYINSPDSHFYVDEECNHVLRYLAKQRFRNVTVYHSGDRPKNNPGKWATRGGFSSTIEARETIRLDASVWIE